MIDSNGFQIQDFTGEIPVTPRLRPVPGTNSTPPKRALGTAVSERTAVDRTGRAGPAGDFTDLTASKENIQYKKWIEMDIGPNGEHMAEESR